MRACRSLDRSGGAEHWPERIQRRRSGRSWPARRGRAVPFRRSGSETSDPRPAGERGHLRRRPNPCSPMSNERVIDRRSLDDAVEIELDTGSRNKRWRRPIEPTPSALPGQPAPAGLSSRANERSQRRRRRRRALHRASDRRRRRSRPPPRARTRSISGELVRRGTGRPAGCVHAVEFAFGDEAAEHLVWLPGQLPQPRRLAPAAEAPAEGRLSHPLAWEQLCPRGLLTTCWSSASGGALAREQ